MQNLKTYNPAMLGWEDVNNLITQDKDKITKTEL